MQPAGRIALDRVAALDDLAAQGAPLQLGNLNPGDRIELVVALPLKR